MSAGMTGDEDSAAASCRSSPASTSSVNTPSRGHRGQRYKTELCRQYEESGTCCYAARCQFAHGRAELRSVARHPKYKTDLCRTFHTTGLCPYGPRCHFIHNDDDQQKSVAGLEPLRAPHLASTTAGGIEFDVEQHLLGLILLAFDPAITAPHPLQHHQLRLAGADAQPSTPYIGEAITDRKCISLSKSCSSVASSSRSASFGDIFNWTSVE